MNAEKLMQPAFAVCRIEDWKILLSSPYFQKIFPDSSAGKTLPEVFSRLSEDFCFLSADTPDIGVHLCPVHGKNIMLLRWMTIRMQNLVPFRFLDVLFLPDTIFSPDAGKILDEEALTLLLDSIHDGIWIIDGNGITLRVNKAMQRIADIVPEEVVGKHVTTAMEMKKFSVCVTLHALNARRSVSMFDDYANGKHCLNTSTPVLTNTATW